MSISTCRTDSTTVWKGKSKRAPTKRQIHSHPGGFGRASKNAFPPEYESPTGPGKTAQAPVEVKTMAKRPPARKETGAEKTRLLKLGGEGEKLGKLAPGITSDVNTTPLGLLSPPTPCISTIRSSPTAQTTGNLTSVRTPDMPVVTTWAIFWSLPPPIANAPTVKKLAMIGCCWSIKGVALTESPVGNTAKNTSNSDPSEIAM